MRLTASHGYALIELLVAFLIISGGTLALMQTQLNGADTERDLLSRIQAHLLLSDIRRKLDSLGRPVPSLDANFDQLPGAVLDCRRVFCSSAQLAAFYVAHWKCRLGRWSQAPLCRQQLGLNGLLAGGDGQIRRHGTRFDITIRWFDADHQPQMLTHAHVLP